MPRPKLAIKSPNSRTKGAYRAEALSRLRQKFENDNPDESFDPSGEPIITPLLKAADGGIEKILEALRAHDEDDARTFIDLYDSLTKVDRKYLTLEEIAVGCGIGSLRLGEIAQSAMILHGQLTTKLLLASSMHKVVRASLKQAILPSGLIDREWMLKSGGILPVPKGATIAIQNNIQGEKQESKDIDTPAPVYLDAGQRLRLIHEAVEQRRLPSPKSEPIEIGGQIDQMQRKAAEILVERESD